MKRLLFLLLILLSHGAWSKPYENKSSSKTSLIISPLQYGFRYAKQMNTDITWQGLPSWAIGGQWQRHLILLDHAQSSDSTGNSTLAFKKERTEWMLSYRYNLIAVNPYIDLQVGLGMGLYNDIIKSRLGAQEIGEESGYQSSALMVTGLAGHWNYLFYGAELQVLAGKDFDPQPTLGGLLRIGIQFAIF